MCDLEAWKSLTEESLFCVEGTLLGEVQCARAARLWTTFTREQSNANSGCQFHTCRSQNQSIFITFLTSREKPLKSQTGFKWVKWQEMELKNLSNGKLTTLMSFLLEALSGLEDGCQELSQVFLWVQRSFCLWIHVVDDCPAHVSTERHAGY